MQKVIECVPNFSEGQRKEVIDTIAHAIAGVEGVALLDIDPGLSTNRTIYTFVGHPQAVIEAALAAGRAAYNLIDMTKHSGEHPRIGAMDVVPFVPVQNATMADCIEIAREFADRLSMELSIPVYLYGEAQEQEYRRDLSQIREGEYEALYSKIRKPEWKPDFGPIEFLPTWGATCVGARKFLIAYNINLLGTKEQAHRIALNVREEGRSKEEPGKLKSVRGLGWWLEEANLSQISLNLTDFEITNIHAAYLQCVAEAESLNIGLCGSQIVGLVPLRPLLMAADYFIQKENLFILDEDQKLRLVIQRLGLNSIASFIPKERIIEYIIRDREGHDDTINSMEIKELVKHVGARTLVPGGSCVTALVATLGTALGTMCALLTYGMRKWETLEPEMRAIIAPLHTTTKTLMETLDTDTELLNAYMTVQKMTETNEEERHFKQITENRCLQRCLEVSLEIMRQINNLWESLERLAPLFNINTKADFLVGIKCLDTAMYGALKRIETFSSSLLKNTDTIDDNESQTKKTQKYYEEEAKTYFEKTQKYVQIILKLAESRNE
ncbi:unnamed protein product [Rotaria magnacalcarata]|uniref:Formimidoyltransferase-cyclodeaminase n=4 Tax=Rotaria magnacalcarata TaxID=392030 RepID=A0A814GQY9_9BILA|nr:unnamed protein product [Rotaria magnacalcarata]CAF1607551.1 unnamed protein product [Rotaria magnacalcarata]CAF2245671.1 unnamed protein product [Rotaria magnacalcarata]CAF3987897.1 unnamed protein product [Rotaria magnacalcarata]CAF3999907.1 unnamed protein product [Rotaria magnacalcarata]